jgi:hypothetical protein
VIERGLSLLRQRTVEVRRDDQHAVRIESQVERVHPTDTVHEQTGADEQQERQRSLEDSKCASRAREPHGVAPHAAFQRLQDVESAGLNRRNHTGGDAGEHGEEDHHSHRSSLHRRVHPCDIGQEDALNEYSAPTGEQQRRASAEKRQQQAFSEYLTQHACP